MEKSLNRNNVFYSLVIFIISPILSIFVAARNYYTPWAKNLIWFFVIFYSVSFTIPSENSDAFFYKTQLEYFHYQNISFADFASNIYSVTPNIFFEKSFDDVIQPTLSYTISQFSDNYRILYLFIGIIFGFFFSRNIWFLVESIKGKVRPVHVLIIISFSMVIAFWSLNSIRMWTAAHIYFYGAMLFLKKGKKRNGIVLLTLSVLMHFSFLLPVTVFFIYLITGNKFKIYFYLFLVTFFINEIDLGFVRTSLQSVLPAFLHRRVETYTNDEIVTNVISVQEKSWHAIYYIRALKYAVFFSVITLYLACREKIQNNRILFNIFSFTLLFLTIAQISSLVPSGGRYLKVAYLFAFTCLFYSIQFFNEVKMLQKAFIIISPALIFFCIVALRIGFDSLSIGLFGNFFSLFYAGPIDTTIIDFLK